MTTEPNAYLVQTLSHGTVRITGTPMVARRGMLRARRPMVHQGQPGVLLADSDGQIVCWIAESEWQKAPAAPTRREVNLNGIAPRQAATAWGRANGDKPKLRLNHGMAPDNALEVPFAHTLTPPAAAMQAEVDRAAPLPPKPKEDFRKNPLGKPSSARKFQVRMVGWLSELVDPLPPLLASVEVGTPLRPFALKVHEQFQLRPGVPPYRLRGWMNRWCGSPDYLRALAVPGAWRYDLTGQPTAPVSDEERRGALERLPAAEEHVKERIAAKKAEQAQPLEAKLALTCDRCFNARAGGDGICDACRDAVTPTSVEHPADQAAVDQAHIAARAAAKLAHQQRFIGRPCPTHGAGAERYVSSGGCIQCAIERAQKRSALCS